MKKLSLPEYFEGLMQEGRYWFTVQELEEADLGLKLSSLRVSLSRLAKQWRLKIIRRGFGILMGTHSSELHPSYYLDAMMRFLDVKYYVGLLTAASRWGASHQSSMAYQVITNKVVKDITFERGRVEFITKKRTFPEKGIEKVSGQGGYYNISTPELTAVDLLRFPKNSGYLNNIATIIDELVEQIDGRKMISLCHDSTIPTVTLQRLGFILDRVLLLRSVSEYIYKPLMKRKPVPSLLSLSENKEDIKRSDFPFDEKWQIYMNTEVEPD